MLLLLLLLLLLLFFAGTMLVHKVIEIAYDLSPYSMARRISSTRYKFYTATGNVQLGRDATPHGGTCTEITCHRVCAGLTRVRGHTKGDSSTLVAVNLLCDHYTTLYA